MIRTQQFNLWIKPMRRFLASGLLATLIHMVVAFSLINLLNYSGTKANVIAFLIANIFSYASNALWSFSSTINLATLTRHIVSSSVSLGLTWVTAYVANHLNYSHATSVIFVIIIVPPISFLINFLWTYR